MQFSSYLSSSVPKIDKALFEILVRWEREIATVHPLLTPLIRSFTVSCQGGKRLRGVLVRLGYELAGGKPDNEIFKIAAAYEIFHTAILTHDDIIDRSVLRRGKPSLYNALGGDHYGISQAISLGDAGFFLALKTIAVSSFSSDVKDRAIRIFVDSMLDTAMGEMLDVALPKEQDIPKEGDVLAIATYKTARYSFAGPLTLGAALAGADKKLLSNLEKLGENLGITYQIQDDILGVFGDEGTLGKSAVSDMQEGKLTLLFIHAKDHADKNQSMILRRYYGKKNLSKVEAEKVKDIFIQTGSLEHSRQKVKYYTEHAKAAIPKLTENVYLQKVFVQLADFLVDRKK